MAAKKKKVTPSQSEELPVPQNSSPGLTALPDTAFAKALDVAAKKAGKSGTISQAVMECIPLPAFCLRYLTQMTGYPLRRVLVVVGKHASYKSTFAGEVSRWFRLAGGGGVVAETEIKPQLGLLSAVTMYDAQACRLYQCTSLDQAQSAVLGFAEQLIKASPNKDVPALYCVDSVAAAQQQSTQDKIERNKGKTGPRFATEAFAIKDWLNYITSRTLDWPISYLLVNHVKHFQREHGMGVDRKSPGGAHIGFQEALELEFERIGAKDKIVKNPFSLEGYMNSTEEEAPFNKVDLKIMVYKNSDGPGSRRIKVSAYYWNTSHTSPSGREYKKLWFVFDWHSATTYLLLGDEYTPPSKVADIRVVPSGGGRPKTYWTPVLGMTKDDAVSAHELGALIEADNDLQEALAFEYNLQVHPYLASSVEYMSKIPQFSYIRDRSERWAEISREQKALMEVSGVADTTAAALRPELLGGHLVKASSVDTLPPSPGEEEEEEWS